MSESRKIIRGTVALTVGRFAGYALSFARNMLLARLLTKADYGLASVFGMAIMLLELSGNMAFGTQTIQSSKGDTDEFQSTAHSLQAIGGICSAILLVSVSVPMAHIFGIPNVWWAFALLALVPLFQGFGHLDISRFQRTLNYTPLVIVDVVPQLVTTLAVWPLAIWLKDYRVILVVMIAKATTSCALSFILAQRRYRWGWNRDHIRSMLSFGWPLLITGFVMFGSQQGEQMLVGSLFSLEMLANYSLAFSIVSIPWYIVGQVLSSLMLPLLSQAQDDQPLLQKRYRLCVQMAAIAGVVCLLPAITAGEQLTTLIFGAKYVGTGQFVALVGAAFVVRFLRFAPALAATARADSLNQLFSNLWRVISLPAALMMWTVTKNPLMIAGCAAGAEIVALFASLIRLTRKQGVPISESLYAGSYAMGLAILGVTFAFLGGDKLGFWTSAAAAIAALLLSLGGARMFFPEVSNMLIAAISNAPAALFRRQSPPGAAASTATSIK